MIKKLLNLFKSKELEDNKNGNINDDSASLHEETTDEIKVDNSILNDQNDVQDESKEQYEEKANEPTVCEKSIAPVQEVDSIYKMYEVSVTWESPYKCFISSYSIKGYTKYTTESVAGAHYHKSEIYELLNIMRKEEFVYIGAYCEKEPDNPYDSNAAKVMVSVLDHCDVKTFHIGYLPREVAKCFKEIDDIPIRVWSIKDFIYTDVYIDVYAENAVYERAVKEKERLLAIKQRYDDNASEIDKLIREGDALEKDGFMEEAMEKFELALTMGSIMPHAAERLMFYYRRKRDYDSEMEVISKFLEQNVYRIDDDYYKERYNKAKELKEKKEQKQLEKESATISGKTKVKKEKKENKENKQLKKSESLQTESLETKKTESLEAEPIKKDIQPSSEQDESRIVKLCSCCNQKKSLECFDKNGRYASGKIKYKSICKECIKLSKK